MWTIKASQDLKGCVTLALFKKQICKANSLKNTQLLGFLQLSPHWSLTTADFRLLGRSSFSWPFDFFFRKIIARQWNPSFRGLFFLSTGKSLLAVGRAWVWRGFGVPTCTITATWAQRRCTHSRPASWKNNTAHWERQRCRGISNRILHIIPKMEA